MKKDKEKKPSRQACESEPQDIGPKHRKSTRKRKGYEKDLNIGTWNVRTLLMEGKLEELKNVLRKYRMDIIALQELRWKGQGIVRDKKQQVDLYYSCADKTGMYGCGFAVCGQLRDKVIGWYPINDRMCTIRIQGKFNNYSFICVYAPTDCEKDLDAKDVFYDQLDRAYNNCPGYDTKLVLGDLNAQIGSEKIFEGTVGGATLKAKNMKKTRRYVKAEDNKTTDNGIRFISFAASRNMIISSTFFRRKEIHKATYVGTDGVSMAQLDHIAIDKRHASSILGVRSMRGAAGSDHFLVRARLRAKISNECTRRPKTSKRHRIEALKIPSIAKEYEEKLGDHLDQLNTTDLSAEEHWNQFSGAITNVATEVLGSPLPKQKKTWFDKECEIALGRKNEARAKWLQVKTRSSKKTFYEERKITYRLFREKKREHEEQQVKELEGYRNKKDIRKFYNKINSYRSLPKPVTFPCKDKNNELLLNADVAMERWAEHFREALNGDAIATSLIALQKPPIYDDHIVEPPTIDEVRTAIKRLKNNKSAGLDNVPAELYKCGGDKVADQIHQIVVKIWTQESWVSQWNESWINPIHKKGDKTLCDNYRGISILNVGYKIFSSILCERLKPFLANIIGSYQCGFRPGKSTTDQIFSLRRILEKTLEYQIDTHHLFIDFKQAYDSIDRSSLFTTMTSFGIPSKLNRLCWLTLANTTSVVRIGNHTSEQFTTMQGFRQGDALSCDFFNLCLEKIVRDSNIQMSGTIFDKSTQLLGYADDIDIIGRRKEDVATSFVEIEKAADRVGLKINPTKTKYMLATRSDSTRQNFGQNVNIGQHDFEVVKEFIYLGSAVNHSNTTTDEIVRRIVLGSRCLFGLSKLLRSKHLTRSSKIQIYHSLILPIVMYGSESWELTAADCEKLDTFERRVLRMIFGALCINGVWRSRYNRELRSLYNHTSIVQKVRTQRLRWLGHLVRMDESTPARKIYFNKPQGNRKQGRPKMRWNDAVSSDLRKLRIAGSWKNKAANREEWRTFLNQEETQRRLLST